MRAKKLFYVCMVSLLVEIGCLISVKSAEAQAPENALAWCVGGAIVMANGDVYEPANPRDAWTLTANIFAGAGPPAAGNPIAFFGGGAFVLADGDVYEGTGSIRGPWVLTGNVFVSAGNPAPGSRAALYVSGAVVAANGDRYENIGSFMRGPWVRTSNIFIGSPPVPAARESWGELKVRYR